MIVATPERRGSLGAAQCPDVRAIYVRGYIRTATTRPPHDIAVGIIDRAADQFEKIGPKQAKEPLVRAVELELKHARRTVK
jgi:hypothetical protein